MRRSLVWPQKIIDALRIAAAFIAGAVYQRQLNAKSRQFSVLQRVTDCGVWDVDLRRGQLWCSPTLLTSLGYPVSYPRLTLRRLLHRIHTRDREMLVERVRACLRGDVRDFRLDLRIRNMQGATGWWEAMGELDRDTDSAPKPLSGLLVSIDDRKLTETQLAAQAATDPLTGLLNRRGFADAFDRLAEDVRLGTYSGHAAVVILDLDYFKSVNDRFGHAVGDTALRTVARIAGDVLHENDILARIGGEEFAVLVRHTGDDEIPRLAERLRAALAAGPIVLPAGADNGPVIHLTLSAGWVAAPAAELTAAGLDTIVTRADGALYRAKNAGRNRVDGGRLA